MTLASFMGVNGAHALGANGHVGRQPQGLSVHGHGQEDVVVHTQPDVLYAVLQRVGGPVATTGSEGQEREHSHSREKMSFV